ncbi:hypothetical protein ACN2XU_13450 [Primorskyibacter sp. 2E107]
MPAELRPVHDAIESDASYRWDRSLASASIAQGTLVVMGRPSALVLVSGI